MDATSAASKFPVGIKATNQANTGLAAEDLSIQYATITDAESAIKMKNVEDAYIAQNELSDFDHGIEYYADQHYQNATVIRKNKITGGTASNKKGHGIVVAPKKDPVGQSSDPNAFTNKINLDIECNKIWYNELGIVGCGELKT
jgi:hypothetical protein